MTDKFHLMQAEVLAERKQAEPPFACFLLVAYDSQEGRWKVHRASAADEHPTYEDACRAADKLTPRWVRRTIVRVGIDTLSARIDAFLEKTLPGGKYSREFKIYVAGLLGMC